MVLVEVVILVLVVEVKLFSNCCLFRLVLML